MKPVDLPPIRGGTWCGAYVEAGELAGHHMWAATIRPRGRSASRRWFVDRPSAYAFAASEADRLDLPLFDNSDPAAEA